MSAIQTASLFRTSREKAFRSVEWIVTWGRSPRDSSGVTAIGIDKILW